MDEQMIMAAMNVILHAGDARNCCTEALKSAREGNFEQANLKMEEASNCIVNAHQTQTELIQSECAGEKHELSLLFIHAQDTLMTIMSEINLSKEMIETYKLIYERTAK